MARGSCMHLLPVWEDPQNQVGWQQGQFKQQWEWGLGQTKGRIFVTVTCAKIQSPFLQPNISPEAHWNYAS